MKAVTSPTFRKTADEVIAGFILAKSRVPERHRGMAGLLYRDVDILVEEIEQLRSAAKQSASSDSVEITIESVDGGFIAVIRTFVQLRSIAQPDPRSAAEALAKHFFSGPYKLKYKRRANSGFYIATTTANQQSPSSEKSKLRRAE